MRKKIRKAIISDKLTKDSIKNKEVIMTQSGNTLCYDPYSGRYFKSDMETLKRAITRLNKTMLEQMSVSLNDLYYEIGLKETKTGELIGWNISSDIINDSYESMLADDGTPCIVLDFYNPPKYGFDDFYKF